MSESDIETRVLHIERELADMKVQSTEQRAALRADVQANCEMTIAVKRTADQVKADTSEIVELLKGLRVFGKLAKWIAAVIGAVLAVFGIGHGYKLW